MKKEIISIFLFLIHFFILKEEARQKTVSRQPKNSGAKPKIELEAEKEKRKEYNDKSSKIEQSDKFKRLMELEKQQYKKLNELREEE